MYVCMHACMHVCMYAYLHVCMYGLPRSTTVALLYVDRPTQKTRVGSTADGGRSCLIGNKFYGAFNCNVIEGFGVDEAPNDKGRYIGEFVGGKVCSCSCSCSGPWPAFVNVHACVYALLCVRACMRRKR